VVVLDSSFLVAYHNARDVHHESAAHLMEEITAGRWGPAVLLEYVFLEVVTVLLVRRGLPTAVAASEVLLQARELEFVPGARLFLDAVDRFQRQQGTSLSFTDAAIAVWASRSGEGFVATFDNEFRKVRGIKVLPE